MKQLAIVLVVILVMSLTGMAQAEMRVVGYSAEKMVGLPGTELEEVLGEHYYLDVETDRTDEAKRIEVDYDTYEMYRNELEAERTHHENLWYVKAGNWCVGAFNDAVDWVTFWN